MKLKAPDIREQLMRDEIDIDLSNAVTEIAKKELVSPYEFAMEQSEILCYEDEKRLDVIEWIWNLTALHLPGIFFMEDQSRTKIERALDAIVKDEFGVMTLHEAIQCAHGIPVSYDVTRDPVIKAQLQTFRQTWSQALDLIGGAK